MKKEALNPGVSPREVWAWSAFDFANSGYTTVVLTAVYNAYFVSVVAGNASYATLAWTLVVAASNILSMLAMPAIGAMADARASKKRWLFLMTAACIAATCGLAFTHEGSIVLAALLIIISNFAYNVGETLNSAFLPELARPEAVGKVSGWGWSFGYCGGITTLGISIALVMLGEDWGWSPDAAVQATLAVTALVFAAASAPIFLLLKERSRPREERMLSVREAAAASLSELRKTFNSLHLFKDFGILSLCGFLYQCGVSVVITLSAVYASAVMGFTTEDSLVMVFLVNITAAAGAFAFGYIQDKIGHKKALGATLLVWIAMAATAATTESRTGFWIAANLAGLAMGSSQSAGRAMVALFAPKQRLAEFYSFWNMALWLSAVVGPVSYGAITFAADNNHRLAICTTGLFFVLALAALFFINIERGRAAASAAGGDHGAQVGQN